MGAVVGVVLAGLVSFCARRAGLDRDRAFYPTLLIVIASYYVLFVASEDSHPSCLACSIRRNACSCASVPI